MTGVPDGLALNLGSGQVLVGPAGVLYLARAMAAAERAAARDGVRPPPSFAALRSALDIAAAEARAAAFSGESGEFPQVAGVRASAASVQLVDPIGANEVARLLRCSRQWARSLLRRGAFVSARRRSGAWVVDRDEVVAYCSGHGHATTESGEGEGRCQKVVSGSRRVAA